MSVTDTVSGVLGYGTPIVVIIVLVWMEDDGMEVPVPVFEDRFVL